MHAIQLTCTPEEFAEDIKQLARVADAEYREAEVDLMAELYRMGVNADDILVPLDIVLSRLTWIAYRAGYMLAKQN
ncbi:hypothetical protein GCM10025857_31590 [Alicyclobacillus contaminans]|uniref:hypothetical protein n=1 Tax=Alicyclobacillus contaminans TaxID=392016 RepID=UPI00042A3490|nr:hypothetical protein [Alicyclobacillus contaminans]GMA51802.1 hypothetical protein GCM10025857_31590 [Alicyclobacillus contaminans]